MDLCLDLDLLWYFLFHKDSWNIYHFTNFSTHVIKEGRFLACVRLAFWDRRRGFLYVLHFENNNKYYETVHTINFLAKLSVNLIYLFSELAFSGSVTAFPWLYWNGIKGPNLPLQSLLWLLTTWTEAANILRKCVWDNVFYEFKLSHIGYSLCPSCLMPMVELQLFAGLTDGESTIGSLLIGLDCILPVFQNNNLQGLLLQSTMIKIKKQHSSPW